MDKKSLIYILLSVLGLIFIYNYIIVPIFSNTGQSNEMGMGMMHRQLNYSYNNSNIMIFILLVVILAFSILIFLLVKPSNTQNQINKCQKCGKTLDDYNWKICPMCGSPIKKKRGDE